MGESLYYLRQGDYVFSAVYFVHLVLIKYSADKCMLQKNILFFNTSVFSKLKRRTLKGRK